MLLCLLFASHICRQVQRSAWISLMPASHAGPIAVATCSISLTALPLPSLQALRLPESGSCLPAKLVKRLLQRAASLTCQPLPPLQALELPEFLKQRNAELVVTADKDGPKCGACLDPSAALRPSARLDELHMPLTCPCAHTANIAIFW